jgi:hypothetical protein
MGSTQDLQILLEKRDARIRELEVENMELKSKLDKYQSIFSSVEGGPVSPGTSWTSSFRTRALLCHIQGEFRLFSQFSLMHHILQVIICGPEKIHGSTMYPNTPPQLSPSRLLKSYYGAQVTTNQPTVTRTPTIWTFFTLPLPFDPLFSSFDTLLYKLGDEV